MNAKIRVGITMGDPSGIGPAVIAKALPKLAGLADFVIIGDNWVLNSARGRHACPVRENGRSQRFIDLKNVRRDGFQFGKIRAEYGRASIEYLDRALELLEDKELDCLVTAPISKEAASLSGFRYPGHTEYLACRAGVKDYAMLLLNKDMKITPVTRHISLDRVPKELSRELIFKNVCLAHKSLKCMFGILRPRIVACGLNPHASDNGLIGDEEIRIIRPALKKARNTRGIGADGPISADVAISMAAAGRYDCVIAMYHDQAMIPLKLCGNNSGVNLTLGLPYARTSPLHGTAFDIASKFNLADPASLVAATLTAIQCARNQKKG
ncbi:MAG: 4-hydroxythreonine-4-phosphate dehydrogenase PdxA [Candidatus Omnitrophota bacterium]|nr:4-hydroxythreonine-4-phosphate dehydrogenase PdxA [Candidatus Omnitrophota bacterium]